MEVLTGHTTQETAYVVEDYPYGFTLRCKIRYWLEFRPGYGYRLMSQTTNPKKPVEVWNKSKASTYYTLCVMFLDEQEHVTWTGLSMYTDLPKLLEFESKYGEGLTEHGKHTIEQWKEAFRRAAERKAALSIIS